jgi:hypothetical protein
MQKFDEDSTANVVTCLLVVNHINELPKIALKSILSTSDSKIVIGYLHEQDIQNLPESDQITFRKLSVGDIGVPLLQADSTNYSGWFTENFFRIVQLKWTLIESLLAEDHEFVIYSDLDVVWQSDMALILKKYFQNFSDVDAAFQSFTYDPQSPKLCMGFAAFRNTSRTRDLVVSGHRLHSMRLDQDPRYGDDDAITELYKVMDFPCWIRELPQTSVSVGSSVNINTSHSKFPGLTGLRPHLFHANFAVGVQNKRLLLRVALSKEQRSLLNIPLTFYWRFLLWAKRAKIVLLRFLN